MSKKSIIIIIGTTLALLAVISAWLIINSYKTNQITNDNITNFEECAAAGNRIQESYPARCISEDGQSFVQSTE